MRRPLAITLLILLPLPVALADIYRSVDAQGHVQYSDTPSPGAELVYSSTSENHASTASSAEPSRIAALAQRGEQISDQLAQREAARAMERDRSAVRSKQCKQAQQVYQQSIEARRLYKVGADGERQYLSDDEADQQRVNNRLAMEAACDGAADGSGNTDNAASAASGTTRSTNAP